MERDWEFRWVSSGWNYHSYQHKSWYSILDNCVMKISSETGLRAHSEDLSCISATVHQQHQNHTARMDTILKNQHDFFLYNGSDPSLGWKSQIWLWSAHHVLGNSEMIQKVSGFLLRSQVCVLMILSSQLKNSDSLAETLHIWRNSTQQHARTESTYVVLVIVLMILSAIHVWWNSDLFIGAPETCIDSAIQDLFIGAPETCIGSGAALDSRDAGQGNDTLSRSTTESTVPGIAIE